MIGWLATGALGLVLLAPWLSEARRRPVRRLRASAPGQFARLSQGMVHYRWQGPQGGPVAVLVHGLTTPSFVWGPIAERLAGQGWRVLSYDLYGRGFSDNPPGPQDSGFFRRQLAELLADQGVTEPVTLIGYSMGGAIAADYTASSPGAVSRLVLIAPAGMGHDLGAAARLVAWPRALAGWVMLAVFPRNFRAAARVERDKPGVPDAIVQGQLAQLSRRGYVAAVLASLRGILAHDLEAEHGAIGHANLPVLAIWGRLDETIPIAARDRLAQWNPAARHLELAQADHSLAYTHADQIAEAIGPARA